MKRRDLIKTGLLMAGAMALSGCNKEVQLEGDDIKPKQTDTFEFTTLLPYDYKLIDKLSYFNSIFKKSKITTLYTSAPKPLFDGLENWLYVNKKDFPDIKNENDYLKYINYARKQGFKIRYFMDSHKVVSVKDWDKLKPTVDKLMRFLIESNIMDIEFANPQSASISQSYNRNFRYTSSSAAEYHNTQHYKYLIMTYPNIKRICVAIDENQNFKLLKALKREFPNIKFEVTVNELCLKGCPARISCSGERKYKKFQCPNIRKKDGLLYSFFKSSVIYPWNLEYYSAIGINNFKFGGETHKTFENDFDYLDALEKYLRIVEYGVNNFSTDVLFKKIYRTKIEYKDTKLTDAIKYFPDPKHFIKNGDMCVQNCEVVCNYCKGCASKFEKYIG